MKLHVVRPEQEAIGNYTRAIAHNNEINLSQVSDNECEVIMANDVIDSFTLEKIPQLIQTLAKKMRMNGTLVIGGTDVRLLCKLVVNDQLEEAEASNIIGLIKSATSPLQIKSLLQQVGLQVISSQITGVHYELTAKRS